MYIELCGIMMNDEEIRQYLVYFHKIVDMHYNDGILHIKDLIDGEEQEFEIEFIVEKDAQFHYEKIKKELMKEIKVL